VAPRHFPALLRQSGAPSVGLLGARRSALPAAVMASPSPSASPSGDIHNWDEDIKQVFHVVGPSQKKEIKRVLMHKKMLSSTSLQLVMYYNFWYSLCYAWFFVLEYRWKILGHGGLRVQYFTPSFFTIWCVAEAGRLYVGYSGNLNEDTPGMAAFLFLTVFPQMLIIIYMHSMQEPLYAVDKIFNGIMLFILCVELVLAWRCMGRFIADKTARFAVEYGEERGQVEESEAAVAEREALERFITTGDESGQQGAEEFDDTIGTLRSGRSTLRGAAAGGLGSEVELTSTRGSGPPSVRASFGGPSVVPYTAVASRSVPRGSSAPRGSGAPSLANTANNLGASFPARSPSLAHTGVSVAGRGGETEEERRARRARDRAIIEGRIVPQRRRDAEESAAEAELQAARDAIAAQQQAAIEQMNASRPALSTLSSPAANRVRIPMRPELHSPPAADAGSKRD